MGTHLRVLNESYQMNTNMTGVRNTESVVWILYTFNINIWIDIDLSTCSEELYWLPFLHQMFLKLCFCLQGFIEIVRLHLADASINGSTYSWLLQPKPPDIFP